MGTCRSTDEKCNYKVDTLIKSLNSKGKTNYRRKIRSSSLHINIGYTIHKSNSYESVALLLHTTSQSLQKLSPNAQCQDGHEYHAFIVQCTYVLAPPYTFHHLWHHQGHRTYHPPCRSTHREDSELIGWTIHAGWSATLDSSLSDYSAI